ncbi:hypothetical protein Pla163_29390 [Planctomycetes bacterium Pla163]|uniref:Uncharacterized protein n=1 Tax=Rohdeia mirabilis TaxID=2528008 RepID=A0A518D2V1_9BACT|nr:hypothetical protein Pla163_29390 [Planctomycetes bacterium Pla163]
MPPGIGRGSSRRLGLDSDRSPSGRVVRTTARLRCVPDPPSPVARPSKRSIDGNRSGGGPFDRVRVVITREGRTASVGGTPALTGGASVPILWGPRPAFDHRSSGTPARGPQPSARLAPGRDSVRRDSVRRDSVRRDSSPATHLPRLGSRSRRRSVGGCPLTWYSPVRPLPVRPVRTWSATLVPVVAPHAPPILRPPIRSRTILLDPSARVLHVRPDGLHSRSSDRLTRRPSARPPARTVRSGRPFSPLFLSSTGPTRHLRCVLRAHLEVPTPSTERPA